MPVGDAAERVAGSGDSASQNVGDAAPATKAQLGDLTMNLASALVALDHVDALEPFLTNVEPGNRERVDSYVALALADVT
jgi:hypothetical protein